MMLYFPIIYIIYIIWLVVWNIHYFPFHIWDVILPIDFHIFQDGHVAPPPTSYKFPIFWKVHIPQAVIYIRSTTRMTFLARGQDRAEGDRTRSRRISQLPAVPRSKAREKTWKYPLSIPRGSMVLEYLPTLIPKVI